MSQKLVRYNDNKSVSRWSRPTRIILSLVSYALVTIGIAHDDANRWGRIKQIEADMIVEYELGLPPRRKKE